MSITTPQDGVLRTGLNVGYSSEYQARPVNLLLLERLAAQVPPEGAAGQFATAQGELPFATTEGTLIALELDPFRRDLPPTISRQDIWPGLLVLASVLFLGDIAIRRLRFRVSEYSAALWGVISRRRPIVAGETLTRLAAKKAELRAEQATNPWEEPVAGEPTAVISRQTTELETPPDDVAEPLSYTARLLEAKRSATAQHRRNKP